MTASIVALWMLDNTWYLPGDKSSPGAVKLQDINGTALTVGQTVKIVGTIQSMVNNDSHYGDVVVKLRDVGGSLNANPTISVHPLNLVVGS